MSLLNKYPVLRSMATYSVLYPTANVVQQMQIRQKNRPDLKETLRYFLYGGFIHSSIVYNWLKFNSKLFPGKHFGAIMAKVTVDQLAFAPCALSCFYVGLSALEGKSKDEIYSEWRNKFPKTWAICVCIWPFLQAVNFRFIPKKNRAVFVGTMSFFWTTALTYWKSEVDKTEAKQASA